MCTHAFVCLPEEDGRVCNLISQFLCNSLGLIYNWIIHTILRWFEISWSSTSSDIGYHWRNFLYSLFLTPSQIHNCSRFTSSKLLYATVVVFYQFWCTNPSHHMFLTNGGIRSSPLIVNRFIITYIIPLYNIFSIENTLFNGEFSCWDLWTKWCGRSFQMKRLECTVYCLVKFFCWNRVLTVYNMSFNTWTER